MKLNELETCVRIYDDVVSKEWCKETIDLFEKEITTNAASQISDDRYTSPDISAVDSSTKSFTEMCIEGKDQWIDVKTTFLNTCHQHFHKFIKDVGIEKHHLPVMIDTENIHYKKYEANDKDVFKNHVDVIGQGPLLKRFLVFIMYLSDVEEGGETSIPRYDIKCKPKAGRLLMFPPYWTHPHQGEKVIKGTKHILMTYLHMGDEQVKFNLNKQ